ncbi:MAG: CHAT domain-containing protein [Nostoc sp. ChiQUE02]|uniref:CHAT domain-containing protein n=1 Tax=Nostoc sp. ChiQUE02 TaxID=3075377 RepID=UPI002AD4576A|nr:CHAT domain-containing protein [Nostoc sp. ChiQUE02]MDZ8233470.1 CHAT domain-containing protein [Nostoc sp. ChiQUE02]
MLSKAKEIGRAIQSALKVPEQLFDQADQQAQEGEYQAALDLLDQALALRPRNSKFWYQKGKILAYNLKKSLQALEAFDNALKFVTDDNNLRTETEKNNFCKQVLNGRGNVLKDLTRNNYAIDAYQEALKIDPSYWQARKGWGSLIFSWFHEYSTALEKLDEGLPLSQAQLKHLRSGVRNYHKQGCGQLHRAKGKIHYKHGLRQSADPFPYWKEAEKSYQQALRFLNAQTKEYLKVIEDLIQVFLALGKIQEAEHLQRVGLDLLNRLLAEAKSFRQKRLLALEFTGFNQLTVDILVRNGKILKAWQTAEEGKNICLKWLLWEQDLLIPTYEQTQQFLNTSTAAIYWHLSPAALTTFVLKPNTPVPVLINSSPSSNHSKIPESLKRLLEFEKWVSDWDQVYSNYRDKGKEETRDQQNNPWRITMDTTLEELKRILDIPAIEAQLTGVNDLILIPHRDLHRFPLHALFNERFTIAYLPSVQVGLNMQNQDPMEGWHTKPLLNVDDPAIDGIDPMPYAQLESAIVRQLFANSTAIIGDQATKANVIEKLDNNYHVFHFTGHGEYNSDQPENSRLGLANDDYLSAKEISQFNLESCDLVTIAACETALTGNQTITTEYVGLVSAFLRAKVTNVLSSLWTVEETSSAWIMIRFYQFLQEGMPPARALNQAQQWLRTVTSADLATWLCTLSTLEGLDPLIKQDLEQQAYSILEEYSTIELLSSPYANPYYWAAFTLTGRGFV